MSGAIFFSCNSFKNGNEAKIWQRKKKEWFYFSLPISNENKLVANYGMWFLHRMMNVSSTFVYTMHTDNTVEYVVRFLDLSMQYLNRIETEFSSREESEILPWKQITTGSIKACSSTVKFTVLNRLAKSNIASTISSPKIFTIHRRVYCKPFGNIM